MKYNRIILTISCVAFLIGCKSTPSSDDHKSGEGQEEQTSQLAGEVVEFSYMSVIPDDIEGCTCLVIDSTGSMASGPYLYVDDQMEVAYVVIGGELKRFSMEGFDSPEEKVIVRHWTNEEYRLSARFDEGERVGDEGARCLVEMVLMNKAGEELARMKGLYGECAC